MANENRVDVAGRIARIEKQLRWWRRCSLALALLVGVASMMGMRAEPEKLKVRSLTTESLTVLDNEGRLRANIAVNDSGGVGINVYTRGQTLGGTLGVSGDGEPSLALYGRKAGKPFVQAFILLSDGEPKIRLLNRDGDDLFVAPPPK
jgi:hypothetical protein